MKSYRLKPGQQSNAPKLPTLDIVGSHRTGHAPYLWIGDDSPGGTIFGSLSGDRTLRALRDALTEALRKRQRARGKPTP